MARPLRIEFTGAVYHITSRGNARKNIFLHDHDRKDFLTILSSVVGRFNWILHAYCLMNNHYHCVVETPDSNLSRGMRQLNGEYTQRFNWWHKRVGHLFQGRYKAVVVDKDNYLLEVCRYVVLNPVRARLASDPDEWYWSSYRGTVGQENPLRCLTVDWLLGQFGRKKCEAQRCYRDFVRDGIGKESMWQAVQGQIILGDEQFVAQIKELLEDKKELKEIPKKQRYVGRLPFDELFKDKKINEKEAIHPLIREAYYHGYTMKEIADYLGMHYSTVSRIIKKTEDNVLLQDLTPPSVNTRI